MYKYVITKITFLIFVSFSNIKIENFMSSQNNIFNFLCHHKIICVILEK